MLWYTGQSGYYGRVDPKTGEVKVWESPRGRGTYGITVTPSGEVYYASLAGNHIARIDTATGKGHADRSADERAGRASRVVRFEGPHLGERVELRQS